MKALVISGGGSKGAFAGGVAEYLIKEKGKNYDLFLGTSTGSLLVTHLALNEIDKIKKLFTNVTQSDIFSNCPFNIKEVKGEATVSINHFNVLKSFIIGSKTFGESYSLKKLIKANIHLQEFLALKKADKDIIVTVSNLTHNRVEFKSIKEFEYEEFCEWIWISCNLVPFMTLVKKDKCEYADGGFSVLIPIDEAIRRGATEVDVIVLDPKQSDINNSPSTNPFSLLTRLIGYMLDRIENYNIKNGELEARLNNIKLKLYFTPIQLTTDSMIFDKIKMKKWWEEGFNYAKDTSDL